MRRGEAHGVFLVGEIICADREIPAWHVTRNATIWEKAGGHDATIISPAFARDVFKSPRYERVKQEISEFTFFVGARQFVRKDGGEAALFACRNRSRLPKLAPPTGER